MVVSSNLSIRYTAMILIWSGKVQSPHKHLENPTWILSCYFPIFTLVLLYVKNPHPPYRNSWCSSSLSRTFLHLAFYLSLFSISRLLIRCLSMAFLSCSQFVNCTLHTYLTYQVLSLNISPLVCMFHKGHILRPYTTIHSWHLN